MNTLRLTYTRLGLAGAAFALAVTVTACSSDPEVAKLDYLQKGNAYFASKKYQEAIIEYRNAIQQDTRFAEAYYRLGEAYAAVSDVKNALPNYVRAADFNPDNVDAQLKALNLLLLARQYEDVRTRARAVLKKDPKHAGALLALGNALAGLRSFDEAVAANERAVSLDPTRSGLFLNLGALQFISGNRAEAEAAFLQAVTVAPNSVDTRLGIAGFYWAARRPADAERELRKALELDPNHITANRQLAAFYIGTGRPALAESHLKRVVDLVKDASSRVALSDYYVSVGRVPEGIALLETLASEEEGFVPAKIRIALIHHVSNRRAEAVSTLDEVLKRYPNNAPALGIKAHMLLGEQRFQEAEKLADAAVLADPRSVRAHFAKGKVQLALGRTNEAQKAFREVIQLDPGASEAHIELSQIHLARREMDSALTFAQQAVSNEPRNVQARIALASILMVRSEDRGRAEVEVRGLAQAFPQSAQVQHLQGELALAAGDQVRAKAAFERALQIDSAWWESLDRIVSMDVKAKRLPEARRRVDAALAKAPDATQMLLLAAKTYAADGQSDKAEQYLKRLIQLEPSNLEGYTTLAALYLVERRLGDARDEFVEISNRQPQSVAPATMVGIIAEAQGDAKTAIEWYDKALRIDARAAAAANNLAWIYADRGENLEVALQLAQVAYGELPRHHEVADTLGWVYYKKDQTGFALPILQRCVEEDPNNHLYHFHLGMIYAKRGDDTKARLSLQRALALRKEFPGADEARRTLAGLLY